MRAFRTRSMVFLSVSGLTAVGVIAFFLHARPFAQQSQPATSTEMRDVPLVMPTRPIGRDWGLPEQRLELAWQRILSHPLQSWSDMLHGLRLRGLTLEELADPTRTQAGYLFDWSRAKNRFGGAFIHRPTRHGLEFKSWDRVSKQGEFHTNQTLSLMAELGLKRDQPITFQDTIYTIADIVHSSMANFVWDDELEWTTVAFSHYLPPQRRWVNKFGKVADFDQLCTALCEKAPGKGSCYGTHTLHAIAILLRADAQEPVLSSSVRQLAHEHLARVIEHLECQQRPDGHWTSDWHEASPRSPDRVSSTSKDPNADDLLVSGHTLEWLAYAPEDIDISERMIERAVTYVLSRILEAAPARLQTDYCPFTHAGNALRLWCPEQWNKYRSQKTALLPVE